MEFYIYADSEDNALEMAGNGADDEFKTLAQAKKSFNEDFHEGKKIYRVTVEMASEGRVREK